MSFCIACNEADQYTGIDNPGDCRANTGAMIVRNPGARALVEKLVSENRCEEEKTRWLKHMPPDIVDTMMEWCPQDNDQAALNRLLITERWAHLQIERGGEVVNHKGIIWRCDERATELDPEFCNQQPSSDYGPVRVIGARYLNRRMDPNDLSCLFNGKICHMYGQHSAFRNIILRSVLECTHKQFGWV